MPHWLVLDRSKYLPRVVKKSRSELLVHSRTKVGQAGVSKRLIILADAPL